MRAWIALACVLSNHVYAHDAKLPHLDLEMTGEEYRVMFENMEKQGTLFINADDPLRDILKIGKRNLDWIVAINSARPSENQLQLTTPEATAGIPITKPSRSSRSIIMTRQETIKAALPQEFLDVVYGTGEIPKSTTVADEEFLTHARALNKLYESASRWLLQEPKLYLYGELAREDIRGYYFLSKVENLEDKLTKWTEQSAEDQANFKEWLVGECFNNESYLSKTTCKKNLEKSIEDNGVLEFHKKHVVDAERVYKSFFKLQNPRKDVTWNSEDPNVAVGAFLEPKTQDIKDWLVTNIEDEWRFEDWQLKLSFKESGYHPKVVFKAGATPNVNGLGGSIITMDANRNINEYGVRWTIRHEYGHVLGLPDCYIEFYDESEKVMINYQIDITNLMCSRRGHLQKMHVDELKSAYFKKQ